MNPIDDLLDAHCGPIDDGLMLMRHMVTAVAWLRRGAMPGLTIWDVVEQALRLRSETETSWYELDPLRAVLQATLAEQGEPISSVLASALRSWLAATSQTFNCGVDW